MIPFRELRREYEDHSDEIDQSIRDVCKNGLFVLGKKVDEFELAFAEFVGNGVYAIAVGSGTEAIHLSLVASGVEWGDYVITVPNTAIPTVSAISFSGATPIFVDVNVHSYTMDPSFLRDTVTRAKKRFGRRLKCIIPVHLYGQSADMMPILEIAEENGLKVIEDACQAHGAEYKGLRVGSLGDYSAFSFYPTKNLGAYGDAGIVLTKDVAEVEKLKMLRNYGQEKRYFHRIKGFNSRLDELQATILLTKLKYLDAWNARRREIAQFYSENIRNQEIIKPKEMSYGRHVFHLYVVRHPKRADLQAFIERRGVQTVIHYPVPIHLQEAYRDLGQGSGSFPVAEKCAEEILSIPIFPQLREDETRKIVEIINLFEGN